MDVAIGPVRADEADAMLDVMCRAFGLPFGPARDVFYADPYFDLDNKIALRVDGQVVSCLTLAPTSVGIGDATLPLVGIANVATRPDCQRRGYAGRLLRATLDLVERRGYALVGLFPQDYAFYRRFGWEQASVRQRLRIERARLPRFPPPDAHSPDGLTLRPATNDDILALQKRYTRIFSDSDTLTGLRDAKRWQAILSRMQHVVAVDRGGELAGYLLFSLQPGRMESLATGAVTPPTLIVHEVRASDPARRAFLAWLTAQEQVGWIEHEGRLRDLEAFGLLTGQTAHSPDEPLATITAEPGIMLRVVNFQCVCETLAVGWTKRDDFSLLLTLRDTARERTDSVRVTCGNGLVTVTAVEAAEMEDATPHRIEGDATAWAQVIAGYVSGADACALGLLETSTPEACRRAEPMFPRRNPFLSAPDYF